MKPPHLILVYLSPLLALSQEVVPSHVLPIENSTPVQAGPPMNQPQQHSTLSPGEARIQAGIVMLGVLHNTLASVKDKDSAEEATASIMRFSRELQEWSQGFSALPPLDEDTRMTYEEKYLPIIRQLNNRIRMQGERIAAAEFYGSQNLPAALVRLVQSAQ